MKIRKRYIALALYIGSLVACQMGFLKFRKSEEKQRSELAQKGQSGVTFQRIEAGGQNIFYSHIGNDTLPLVVLVHGSPGSSGQSFIDYLADTSLTNHAQIVAFDRPGFGYSNFGKAEGSLEKQAAVIKSILQKHLPVQHQKAILLGHSYGGPVIVRAAMDFPDVVGGLVIVAGSIDPELEPKPWWQAPLNWRALRWMLPPAFRVSNQEIIPLREELQKMMPLWGKITCPVTVIQGTKDTLVPAGNAGFSKKMLVNSARVDIDMVDGGSHFILWTMQGKVVGKIIEMLGSR